MKNLTLMILSLIIISQTTNSLGQTPGTLDPSFGTGGKVTTSISSEDKAFGVEIQSDGKILVAGYSTSAITGKDFTCVRYNIDGSLDNTFGTGGIVTTDVQLGSDDIAYDITIQTDGKFILAGYSDDGSNKDASLVRYNSDGTIDLTFGVNGVVLTDFDNSQQDEIKVVKVHPLTGKIIVGGASIISSNVSKPVVARYLSNGSLDTTFNMSGIRLLWVTSLDYQYLFSVEDIVVQPNGKISAIGWRDFPGLSWDSDYWAGRINNNGTMDATFSTDGVSVYNGGFNGHDRAHSMILKANNDIVLAGGGYVSALNYRQTIFEISATGPSTGWAAGVNYTSNGDDIAYSLNVDLNGNYVMAGSAGTNQTKSFAITRLTPSPSLDLSFGGTGKVTTTFNGNSLNECFDALVQPDNRIVAAGYSGSDFAIARYLGDITPQLDGFQLQTPVDLAVEQNYSNMSLNWTDAFGATSYEIDLDVNATFAGSPQTLTSPLSIKSISNLMPNTQYFWRVRASDGTNFGQYSTVWSFTTNSLENFNLQTPVDLAIDVDYSNAAFNWTDAIGSSSYEMDVDVNATFSGSPQTFTITNSANTLNNLQPNTQYFWRVRATDGSVFGQYSPTWSFTTNSLENFNLISPANNSIDQDFANPSFDWSDAVGAAIYEIEFDTDPTFLVNPIANPAMNSNSTYAGSLTEATDYYWRVRASSGGGGGTWGQWSPTWKFTTKADDASLSELENLGIRIYPNPTSGFVTMDLNNQYTNAEVNVFNSLGQLIENNSFGTTSAINLQISGQTGIYFIELFSEGQLIGRSRIVKD